MKFSVNQTLNPKSNKAPKNRKKKEKKKKEKEIRKLSFLSRQGNELQPSVSGTIHCALCASPFYCGPSGPGLFLDFFSLAIFLFSSGFSFWYILFFGGIFTFSPRSSDPYSLGGMRFSFSRSSDVYGI